MNASLPILARRREIEDAIRAHQVVVVCGATGSGKTTQLPQICMELASKGDMSGGVIAHTQPRRLAARAVAARIAEEMGVRLGGTVGVKVRFQDQTSRATRIKLMTDGMLLAELADDPDLRAYSVVIIDEAHERSLNVDFLLGYLRRLRERRPDLKIIITSATIDPRRFADFFGDAAPVIEVSGRMYPVEVRYRPEGIDEDEPDRVNAERVADAVEELARPSMPPGDVLVFLPGEREIRAAADALRRRDTGVEILSLFARLSAAEQDRIFHPSGDRRRVILATNVAETSLTVPGIRYVVDTGLARLNRYDPERKVERLPIEPISRASADQRAGRCGRVAAGVCIRLYSEESYRARPPFTDPEIRRSNLAGVVLQMATLGLGPVDAFPFLDPPDARAIHDAYETLFELGAIDAPSGLARLTPVGRAMARLPVDLRVARMMLAARAEGVEEELVVLAAALSIQDPRERPLGRHDDADRAQLVFRDETSDFLTLLRLWEQYSHAIDTMSAGDVRDWCRRRYVSHVRMREWSETVRQLRDLMSEVEWEGLDERQANSSPPPSRPKEERIHRALLTGLISNVACRHGDAGSFSYRGVHAEEISIFPGSVLFKKAPKWIMAAELVHTTKLYARTVARIEWEWIEELAGHMLERRVSDPHLDPASGEPIAWERVTVCGIVVVPRRRTELARLDPNAARDIFLRDALAACAWKTDAPFMAHNRAVLDQARSAEAKLRRRSLTRRAEEIAGLLDRRVPAHVRDPATLHAWIEHAGDAALRFSLDDVLRPEAHAALDEQAFPSTTPLAPGVECPLEYTLAPGKDEDGITLTATIAHLGLITPQRAQWLVPGWLKDVIAALIKTLPRSARIELEAKGAPERIAEECAGVLDFAQGSLVDALADAIAVLYSVKIDPAQFNPKALPSHLVLRVRVIDDHGKELAATRDLPELHKRFESRIRKAAAARARAAFERDAITTWDFDALPAEAPVERDGVPGVMYPALVDETTHVRLTLAETRARADSLTHFGVRRLFALACAGEVEHRITAMSEWDQMSRQYHQLGTPAQLKDELICIVAARAFMAGRPDVRTKEDFEARLQDSWGKLAVITREVVEVVARVLDARARIAQRLSGGTPRLWADSVADIREHAAYLMPVGFLRHVAWEQLRHYPRYVEAMRERLFSLREGGSGAEKGALAQFAPYWKRFTAWVARTMNEERAAQEPEEAKQPTAKSGKAPLPQTRRNSPVVNVDAGVWAMTPGNLPPDVARCRWALEEARVTLFVPAMASKPGVTLADLDALWKRIEAPTPTRG